MIVSVLVLSVIAFDILSCLYAAANIEKIKLTQNEKLSEISQRELAYNATIDCVQSLITAIFSSMVLSLFIGAYISLVYSLKQLLTAIREVSSTNNSSPGTAEFKNSSSQHKSLRADSTGKGQPTTLQ